MSDQFDLARFLELAPELSVNSHEDDVHDEIHDLLSAESETLFLYEWDSGAPGAGAGTERVLKFRGKFFFDSGDFGVGGPFETFYDALEHLVPMSGDGKILVGSAATSYGSSIWSRDELIKNLEFVAPWDQDTLEINGIAWDPSLGKDQKTAAPIDWHILSSTSAACQKRNTLKCQSSGRDSSTITVH
ncbi:MAG: hypothetical protein WEE89_08605 [Gemmatimonadota bacterium]